MRESEFKGITAVAFNTLNMVGHTAERFLLPMFRKIAETKYHTDLV